MAEENLEENMGMQELLADLGERWEQGYRAPASVHYSLSTALDQASRISVQPDEIYTRLSLDYLGGRRWGLAREERNRLHTYLEENGQSTVQVTVLDIFADFMEGQSKRASLKLGALLEGLSVEDRERTAAELYILRAMAAYISEEHLNLDLDEDLQKTNAWRRSQVARSIYRARHETVGTGIDELGAIADSMMVAPGLKRFIGIWLRAIQGNALIYRGDFAWAERVLDYALNRCEVLMDHNQVLRDAIARDLELARAGVENKSVA